MEDLLRELLHRAVDCVLVWEPAPSSTRTPPRWPCTVRRSPMSSAVEDAGAPAARLAELRARAIVSSGCSNDPVMADYARHGFCGVLSKPYRLEELRAVLFATFASA